MMNYRYKLALMTHDNTAVAVGLRNYLCVASRLTDRPLIRTANEGENNVTYLYFDKLYALSVCLKEIREMCRQLEMPSMDYYTITEKDEKGKLTRLDSGRL